MCTCFIYSTNLKPTIMFLFLTYGLRRLYTIISLSYHNSAIISASFFSWHHTFNGTFSGTELEMSNACVCVCGYYGTQRRMSSIKKIVGPWKLSSYITQVPVKIAKRLNLRFVFLHRKYFSKLSIFQIIYYPVSSLKSSDQ